MPTASDAPRPGHLELVADRGDHHLDHRDQGGDAGDHQRAEEQHADQGSCRRLGDDRREGDERQPESLGRHLGDGHPVGLRDEAEGGEDADAGQQLEARVGEADHGAGAGHVGLRVHVRRVRDHDPEADRQREEDLPEGRGPHAGLAEGRPVGREEGVEAEGRARQEQRPDHQGAEGDDEHRDEDDRRRADPLLDPGHHDHDHRDPHDRQRPQHAGDEVELDAGVAGLQEVPNRNPSGSSPHAVSREKKV